MFTVSLGPRMGMVARTRTLFDGRVWTLTYGQTILSLGRGILMPFATLYFYNVRHFPLAAVGLALAIAFPLGSLAGLFWGAIADRVGRKPLMVLGFAGQALTTLSLAFIDTLPQYFAAVILNQVFISAWAPASRAMVADVTPEDRRTRAFGLLYMANNLGTSLGLLVGAILVIFLPYRALFIGESAGAAGFLLVVLLLVRESHAPGPAAAAGGSPLARVGRHFKELSTPLRDRVFLAFIGVTVLGGIGWAQFYITYAPFMKNTLGFADATIGLIIAINTVMVVALQVPIAAWAEKRSRMRVLIMGNALLGASLLVTWEAPQLAGFVFAMMVLAIVIMTVGEIMNAPIGPSLAAGLARTPANYGKYMAAFDLTWSLSSGLGSLLGGWFFDAGRAQLLWPVMTISVVGSMAGFALLSRHLPGGVDEPKKESEAPVALSN